MFCRPTAQSRDNGETESGSSSRGGLENATDAMGESSSSLSSTKLTRSFSTMSQSSKESVRFYVAIEAAWHVILFSTCYCYRPMRHLARSKIGKGIVERVHNFTPQSRKTGSSQQGPSRIWQKVKSSIPGGRRTAVAASEWFVLNKIIGIPLLPSKVALSVWLANQYSVRRSNECDQKKEKEEPKLKGAF
jgi:hypothetical protein